ncbi:hypothetical protein EMIT0P176_50071 [Pseudomonas sp. IT-P176]
MLNAPVERSGRFFVGGYRALVCFLLGVYPLLRLGLLRVSPLRRLTFFQTPKKVCKKRLRYDSPTWVTNQFTHIGNSF